ncbi:MAG TPA: putative lipid II flippase FtsW [Gaiellaceae bacterium]|nr:putative lipid II flippase FtsW [Gaiellaceae bacterium]
MKKGQFEQQLLLLVTLALVAFGLVMVYSATSASAALANGDSSFYLRKQGLYALVGVVLLLVARRTNYRTLRHLAPMLVLTSIGLLLAVLAIGTTVNGARRWITVGPAVFQPSEFAKLALLVFACAYLARRPAPQTLGELIKPLGILTAVICALLLAEPDLGTAITITVMLGGVLVVSGAPSRLLASAGGIAVFLVLAAAWFEPYRRARLLSFLNPWSDAQGAGYQTVQAMIGLGSGGIFGEGLGQSVLKANYLPEAHTDMIFAIIGEELGLVGATALIAAYAAFAYAGFRVALTCKDPFGKRLAAGITTLVCGQALINIAAVMGAAPLTGITLPFVSYGGSSLVVGLAAVGILLNIAGDDGRATARSDVSDRNRRNRRPRAPGARSGGGASRSRRRRDVRRVSRAV